MTVVDQILAGSETELIPKIEYTMTLENRTPEQVEEARQRIYAPSAEPCAVPVGLTLEDKIVGQWPGDESDEEVTEALRELS